MWGDNNVFHDFRNKAGYNSGDSLPVPILRTHAGQPAQPLTGGDKMTEDTYKAQSPFSFDGHGINDAKGQRLAKMSDCSVLPKHLWTTGKPCAELNPEFDRVGNLLAAAPDLLAACKDMLELIDPKKDWTQNDRLCAINHAKAAINKATKE